MDQGDCTEPQKGMKRKNRIGWKRHKINKEKEIISRWAKPKTNQTPKFCLPHSCCDVMNLESISINIVWLHSSALPSLFLLFDSLRCPCCVVHIRTVPLHGQYPKTNTQNIRFLFSSYLLDHHTLHIRKYRMYYNNFRFYVLLSIRRNT